jgi:hypothetical protein
MQREARERIIAAEVKKLERRQATERAARIPADPQSSTTTAARRARAHRRRQQRPGAVHTRAHAVTGARRGTRE